MFIHPASKKNNTLVNNIDSDMIQPNTIDLRVQTISRIGAGEFSIDEENKQHRKQIEVPKDSDGYWELEAGGCYAIDSNQYIEMGEGEVGIVLGRSTFNRNGVLIVSSVYDSGFKDYVGATLYNIGGLTRIRYGTRFAHLILTQAETLSMYQGDYGDN